MKITSFPYLLFPLLLIASLASAGSSVVTKPFTSEVLSENLVGVRLDRDVMVYLPDGYEDTDADFPVIYYLHNFFWSNHQMFADGVVQATLDRAIDRGVIPPVVMVIPDFSSDDAGGLYSNGPVLGRWEDFFLQEVIPLVEREFRVARDREGRGIVGEFFGGYAALRYAMLHPDMFGTVYAMHPVATGTGYVPMASRPNWERIHAAEGWEDLEGLTFATVFVPMAQAYAPNPDRPPFFADFMQEPNENGEIVVHHENSERLRQAFLLDRLVQNHVEGMRSLRGIKFDWGRYDPNQDHVLSNQNFTRLLDELGIPHEAEEYRGGTWDQNWTEYGRFYSDVLPFFARHLE